MRSLTLALLAVAVSAGGCHKKKDHDEPAVVDTSSTEKLGYFGLEPLIRSRCVGCHGEGGVAFSLADEAAVYEKKASVVAAIESRRMPVWLPEAGHELYEDDPTFNDIEIELFQKWRDAGYPRGEPLPSSDGTVQAMLHDLEADVSMPILPEGESFAPTTEQPDDYRCFVLDWPVKDRMKYITGFQAIPGERAVVHHVAAYKVKGGLAPMLRRMDAEEDGLGYRCFLGAMPDRLYQPEVQAQMNLEYPGLGDAENKSMWVGHWAPGMLGSEMPQGIGIPIEPDSVIVAQVHYYSRTAPGVADKGSEIRFKLADEVEKPAVVLPFSRNEWLFSKANRSLVIPPHAEATVSYEVPLTAVLQHAQRHLKLDREIANIEVHAANLHLHSYGKSAETYLIDKTGARDVMLSIPRWDLNWQRDFTFETPKIFPVADAEATKFGIRCTFANRSDKEVFGGYGSDEEMCFNFALIAFDLKK